MGLFNKVSFLKEGYSQEELLFARTWGWKLQTFLVHTSALIFLKHYLRHHVPAQNLQWLCGSGLKSLYFSACFLWSIWDFHSYFPFLSNMHAVLIRQVFSVLPETCRAWLQIMVEIPPLCSSKFYSPFKVKINFFLKSHVSSESSQSLLSLLLIHDAFTICT